MGSKRRELSPEVTDGAVGAGAQHWPGGGVASSSASLSIIFGLSAHLPAPQPAFTVSGASRICSGSGASLFMHRSLYPMHE